MKCPICSAPLPLGSDRCPDCGYRLRTAQAAPQQNTPYYTPPNPTKKSKGCCCCGLLLAIPAVILIAALIFGMASLVMEEIEVQIGGFDAFEDFPFLEEEPVPFDEEEEDVPEETDSNQNYSVRFCHKCGGELPPDSAFCPYCRQKITM